MTQIRIKDLFAEEITNQIKIFMGGRDTYDYEKLTPEEIDAVHLAFDKGLKRIENVSPKLAANLRPQREGFIKFAGIAKATFPETKSYSYPAVAGGLGADWITPELLQYRTTSLGATVPAYSDYNYNTFDCPLAASTAFYILGVGSGGYQAGGTPTTAYKGSQTSDKHSFVVFAQDGFVELGTTPRVNMVKFLTDLETKYNWVSMNPLLMQTMEDNRAIYQYNTPGMMPVDHNVGAYIELMPNATGTSTIVPLGMCFYEYSFITTIPRSASTP